jgi:membrane protease YdiL (CAAX protease family)
MMKNHYYPNKKILHSYMRKPSAVIALTLVLTAICYIESAKMVPWSPYFILFAGLTVILSRLFDSTPILPTRMNGRRLWLFMALMIIVCCTIDAGVFTIGWDWFLARIGLEDKPFYSMAGALNYLIATVAHDHHITLTKAQAIFGAFVLLWAPVGEELFYRGYVYNSLKELYSRRTALLITCFLFALRHITHFSIYGQPFQLQALYGLWTCSSSVHYLPMCMNG